MTERGTLAADAPPPPSARAPVLDAGFAPLRELLARAPAIASLSPEAARRLWDDAEFGAGEPVDQVEDTTIAAAHGAVPVRLYRPKRPDALIVFLHGGGWVLGGIDTHDVAVRAFANRTRAAIASVGYRLAPEHPYPAALDDAFAVLEWARGARAELLGSERPLLVAGDSAGGNLAAALCLLARQRGGPRIDGQVLIYPVLDARCATPSWIEHADCFLLKAADMRWYWRHYAGAGAAERGDPLTSPTAARELGGLPGAVVAVAEIDPLRDEGLDYAERLGAAGNAVRVLRYPTLPHGFFNFAGISPAAAAAFDEIADATVALIGRGQP